jgi:hypothetical protein
MNEIIKREVGRIVRHAAAPLIAYAVAKGAPAELTNWAVEGAILLVTYGVVYGVSLARDRAR